MIEQNGHILSVNDLKTYFQTEDGVVKAVDGITFTLEKGETLGIGVQAPFASWGSLAADGIKNISVFPWQLIFPGVTMALTLFSLNFLGDGLRVALDPQTRKF